MNYDFEKIQRKVKCSLNKLMEYDKFLLEENVNERSITHKLAEYLQQEFKEWDVDCEYNRMTNGHSITKKTIIFEHEDISIEDQDAKTVFPDIIIHKRNTEKNLLVIEAKKSKNNNYELDEKKLEMFTSDQFGYFYGLHIILQVDNDFGKPTILRWYKEGKFDEYKYNLEI